MADFVPPTFKDFGKKCGDLFKKGFNYDNKLKTKHTTKQGYVLETEGNVNLTDNTVQGQFKGKKKSKNLGEFTVETHTLGTAYASAKLTKLVEGLTVTVGAGTKHKTKKDVTTISCNDEVALEYGRDFFKGTLTVGQAMHKLAKMADTPEVSFSGAIGTDGLSVGVNAKVSVAGKGEHCSGMIDEIDFGAVYDNDDFIAHFATSKDAQVFTTSVYHKLADYTIGTQFIFDHSDTTAPTRTLNIGADYKVDANTNVVSAYSTSGDFQVAVKHNMSNPCLKLDASNKYNVNTKKSAFGVTLSFGEF